MTCLRVWRMIISIMEQRDHTCEEWSYQLWNSDSSLSLSFARLYQIDQTHRLQNLDTVALFAVVPVGLVRRSKQTNIHCTQVTISLFTIVSRGLLTCCQNTPLAVLGHTVLSDGLLLCSFFFFSFLLGWGWGRVVTMGIAVMMTTVMLTITMVIWLFCWCWWWRWW